MSYLQRTFAEVCLPADPPPLPAPDLGATAEAILRSLAAGNVRRRASAGNLPPSETSPSRIQAAMDGKTADMFGTRI